MRSSMASWLYSSNCPSSGSCPPCQGGLCYRTLSGTGSTRLCDRTCTDSAVCQRDVGKALSSIRQSRSSSGLGCDATQCEVVTQNGGTDRGKKLGPVLSGPLLNFLGFGSKQTEDEEGILGVRNGQKVDRGGHCVEIIGGKICGDYSSPPRGCNVGLESSSLGGTCSVSPGLTFKRSLPDVSPTCPTSNSAYIRPRTSYTDSSYSTVRLRPRSASSSCYNSYYLKGYSTEPYGKWNTKVWNVGNDLSPKSVRRPYRTSAGTSGCMVPKAANNTSESSHSNDLSNPSEDRTARKSTLEKLANIFWSYH